MTSCSTSACGTGDWDGPRPGDPDNNVTLSATPAFGGIDVSWTYPTTNPEAVAYVELYRGISSTFSNAILLATVGGNFFYDKSTNAQLIEYFYWIKIVSVNGTVGAVIGPASAVAKPPIATVIEQLTGRIDAGLLAQSLKTDIDRITLNYAELSQEIQDRISANNVFSMGLEQLQLTVEEATTYLTEEITSRQDGDSALLSQVNLIAAANATNQAAIQTEQTARVTADSAISQSVTQLSTQVNNPTTGLPATRAVLLNDYYTKTTTDSAIATAVNALGSQVTSTLTGYTNTATLTQNYYTKSATDSAISNATSTLVSTTALNTTLGSYQTKAALQQDYYTKTSTDSAIANAVSSLVSTTALNTALGSYTTTSVLGQNFYTKTQTDSAISSATLNLVSTTELTNALVPYATNAAISQNYYTKTQTDSAIASATTTFMSSTQVNGAITSALTPYTTTAALQTNYYTKTATDSAISSAITTSQSTLNGNIASAQTNLQTNINTVDGKVTAIGARYTAVVSVNGLIGGFGVYNDGSTIQAGFDVDEFWVGNTQANKRKPFIISEGQVFIDQVFIANGAITSAQIADAAITSANIGDLQVNTAKIGTNAVTVPIGAELSADIQLPQVSDFSGAPYSSWATIFEGTADFGGQPLHFDFDYSLFIRNDNNVLLGKATMQFLINNTLVASQAEFSADSFAVFRSNSIKRFISSPGSGSLNLKVVAKTDPGMTASMLSINTSQFFGLYRKGTSMFVLGTKR